MITRVTMAFGGKNFAHLVKPLAPTSDQNRISPHNINRMSDKLVTRIKKNVTKGIVSWSNTQILELTS